MREHITARGGGGEQEQGRLAVRRLEVSTQRGPEVQRPEREGRKGPKRAGQGCSMKARGREARGEWWHGAHVLMHRT